MKAALLFLLTAAPLVSAAGLDFPTKLKEIHAPPEAKTVTVDFEFANRGPEPVRVARYDATCSCMAVTIKDGKLRYAPGESGVFRAVFDMGNFSGDVDKSVAVYLDDDPDGKPSVVLTTRVHIPVLVSVEPKTLKWDLGGEPARQTIRIAMNHGKPIHVTGIRSSSGTFKHELKTVEDGRVYELALTPLDVSQPALAILRIETDCEIAKHQSQQAFAVIRKPTPAEAAAKK